jgi:hypothetical protein
LFRVHQSLLSEIRDEVERHVCMRVVVRQKGREKM